MYSQLQNLQVILMKLVLGQEYTLCVAGAPAGIVQVQFQPPGTSVWMNYPNLALTAPGNDLTNPDNVVTSGFYAFAVDHRITFSATVATPYWFSIAPITMAEY